MIACRWRGTARFPSQRYFIPRFSKQSSDDTTAQLLVTICNRKFASSGQKDDFNVDFYERQVRKHKTDNDQKLSLVRPLPKSALNHEKQHGSLKRKNAVNVTQKTNYKKFEPRGPKGRREHPKTIPEYQQESRDNRFIEAPVSKQPMFRRDWIKLKNTQRQYVRGEEHREQSTIYSQQSTPTISRQASAPSRSPRQKAMELQNYIDAFPPNKVEVFVSCLPGLEPYLEDELKGLGMDCKMEPGGATITSTISIEDLFQCHLNLGTASHILLRCGKPFTARGLPELKRKISRLPWKNFLRKGTELQLRVSSKKSKLNHKTAVRTAVLEGINESFSGPGATHNSKAVSQANAESEKNALHMLVRVERDEVHVSIDTSDSPIHRRGYRLETSKAPLREDLAYAMLYSAGWRSLADHASSSASPLFQSLLDPFCGSGTIAIEAAAIAVGLPPGRLREAPLGGTLLFHSKEWRQFKGKALRKATRRGLAQDTPPIISASDRDQGAIDAAKNNAERAGVADFISFQCTAISSHPWPDDSTSQEEDKGGESSATTSSPSYPLLIATNPPFGMRIAADKKRQKSSRVHPLLPLYQTLIDRLRRLANAGHKVSAITLLQDPNLFRRTGVDMNIKFSSQHGGLPVAAVMTDIVPDRT